jgi:hypothetical protein
MPILMQYNCLIENGAGIFLFTHTAEFTLHISPFSLLAVGSTCDTGDQTTQLQKIHHPEGGAPGAYHHERVFSDDIGPSGRNLAKFPSRVMVVDPVFSPRVPVG